MLFVVKADQSERGAVIHSMEQMEYAKAKVLGYVFNGMNPDSGSGYGKYRYSKYGRYGYGYKGYGYGYGYHSKTDGDPFTPTER